ncbi:MFS transporter [Kutzneria sp. CA-103260]|uniref:MFS transporter n=1 Tax=Kutzneria sp. CA-103260 TaxID=2802641 RepID=UPI001BA87E45|nr:MFS transporter [Kutzneria sp. CA-103260]QUQ67775.1 MFS transporter [Kutzneria sp. CA-103260]
MTYAGVLANTAFRVLFTTRTLAVTADTVRIVALSVLVFAVTGSPLLAAVAYGISFLPQLIGGSLLGAVADLLPPRQLIALGYGVEFGSGLLLGLVDLPIWLSMTLVAAVSTVTPLVNGAVGRVVADVLDGESYVLGRSLLNLASSAAQLVGMAGAGAAVAVLGAQHAMLVTAGLHLVAAAWVWLRLPDLRVSPGERGALTALRRSLTGNRELLRDRTIRALILAQWLPPACVTAAESLIVPYVAARGLPTQTGGLLLACLPVGMMIGSLVIGRVVGPEQRRRLMVPMMAVVGLPLLGFAVADLPVEVCGALLVLAGVGFAYGLPIQQRFRDVVPTAGRGQAFGLLSTGLMTAQGISPAVAGALAGVVPVSHVIALCGVGAVLTALVFRLRAVDVAFQSRPAEKESSASRRE